MGWALRVCAAAAALALLGRGQDAENEGRSLSPRGYHLCARNRTITVTFLAVRKVPYAASRPCGGWLLWKTCAVTLYKLVHRTEYRQSTEEVTGCCDGFVRVGRYCALPVNRSEELATKPGSCPDAAGSYSSCEGCKRDLDCPGWQKCCRVSGGSLCREPASSEDYPDNGGYRFNVTVTVKTDFQQLMSREGGLLNHTRLLHAMVTGALGANVSVHHLAVGPVHPYRTASSLLIHQHAVLSLHGVTSELHLLLKRIPEVSSVVVEDVDECEHAALRRCSANAACSNTAGSYRCSCRPGYLDVEPGNPGARCTAAGTPPSTDGPPPQPTSALLVDSTSSSAVATLSSTISSTGSALPSISSLQSANISGTSFFVRWTSTSQENQTYHVVLRRGAEVIHVWETRGMATEVAGLDPGVVYTVEVIPFSSGIRGRELHVAVRTDARTLDATTRLTNVPFTADLQDASSPAFRSLAADIADEIYRSLPAEKKAMVDSGLLRIEVRNFSPGSVVVEFTIISIPTESGDIGDTSDALLLSLLNSSRYSVDENSTFVTDFDECAPGENDCSPWAFCENTWASYTCACLDGFVDVHPQRPGRDCEAAMTSTTATLVATVFPSVSPAPFSQTASMSAASTTATASTPETTSSVLATDFTDSPTPSTALATAPSALATPSTSPATISKTPAATSAAPASTPAPLAVASAATATATAVLTKASTASTGATAPSTGASTETAGASAASTGASAASTGASAASTGASAASTGASAASTGASAALATTYSAAPPASTLAMQTVSSTLTTAIAAAIVPGTISVQCRVPAITVTVARDFLLSRNIRDSDLYLGLEECGVNGGNATHAQLTVTWNECLTRLVNNDTYYTAAVTLFSSLEPSAEKPRVRLEVPVVCTYMRTMLMSADSTSAGHALIQDMVTGSGVFRVTVQLLSGTSPLPHNYSLAPEEAVVVEVRMNTSAEQIRVVIQSCWATPSHDPGDVDRYVFLDDRCALNIYTRILENGNSSASRVSVQIFSFVSASMIYLHCRVKICLQDGGTDTCVPDCAQRTARAAANIGSALGSSGPLLKAENESLVEKLNNLQLIGLSCLGVGLGLFFIVGFVCLFYYQRNRIGHYNFAIKPRQENFSYLVFNT